MLASPSAVHALICTDPLSGHSINLSQGWCESPIRLLRIDPITGEVCVVLVRCKTRHEAKCFYCSQLYANHARRVLLSGMQTDELHFLTLTAPGMGVFKKSALAAQSRLTAGLPQLWDSELAYERVQCKHHTELPTPCLCPKGFHKKGDALIGQPIKSHQTNLFDYDYAARFNYVQPQLWDTFMHELRRLTRARYGDVTFAYCRVAEHQSRGLIHQHVVLRGSVHAADIARAVTVAKVQDGDDPYTVYRYGENYTVDSVSPTDTKSVNRMKRYLVKYLTKGLAWSSLNSNPHLRALRASAYELGVELYGDAIDTCKASGNSTFHDDANCTACQRVTRRIRRLSFFFGYGGHVMSKSTSKVDPSRAWGTTFKELREAASAHVVGDAFLPDWEWAYVCQGYNADSSVERSHMATVQKWIAKEIKKRELISADMAKHW